MKPLPGAGTLVARNRVQSITDKGAGKGAIAVLVRELLDERTGETIAESRNVTFLRGDGGFSATSGVSDPGPEPLPPVPERAGGHRGGIPHAAAGRAAVPAERRLQPAARRPGLRRARRVRASDPARPVHLRHGRAGRYRQGAGLRRGTAQAHRRALHRAGVAGRDGALRAVARRRPRRAAARDGGRETSRWCLPTAWWRSSRERTPVYLVTGAFGALGTAVAAKLAAQGARLVLVDAAHAAARAARSDRCRAAARRRRSRRRNPGRQRRAACGKPVGPARRRRQHRRRLPLGIDCRRQRADLGPAVRHEPEDGSAHLPQRAALAEGARRAYRQRGRSGRGAGGRRHGGLRGVQVGGPAADRGARRGDARTTAINVNAVLPSIIDTPANRRDMPEADHSRWVAPDALADVVAFLLGDGARAITGAGIPVTGRS